MYLGESGVYIRSQRGRKEPGYVGPIAYGRNLDILSVQWEAIERFLRH